MNMFCVQVGNMGYDHSSYLWLLWPHASTYALVNFGIWICCPGPGGTMVPLTWGSGAGLSKDLEGTAEGSVVASGPDFPMAAGGTVAWPTARWAGAA